MPQTLLSTKLYFPAVRSSLVARPRLIGRLDQGLRGPLTLISAPAGYGKTTLMSAWRPGPGRDVLVAWFSVDPSDNDPVNFFRYLTAALEPVCTGLSQKIFPLLQSPNLPTPDNLLTILINALSDAEQGLILVFDDYHFIENKAIDKALAFLLDHLPRNLHLVILTRADPALPLARFRARDQLTEIRAEHLRFNVEESARFLNEVMALNLTGEQVAALERRTEGWIGGLQLAALSMQNQDVVGDLISAFSGNNRYIVDYLMEEVLIRQPKEVQDFLLETSVLDRMNAALCDTVTGRTDAQSMLEIVERKNLFLVPLDGERGWYRYHHLFADQLRARLSRLHAEQAASLQCRASQWCADHGLVEESITYALRAKDFERAAEPFCQDRFDLMNAFGISLLDKWLRSFPDPFLRANPWLCISKAHILWSTGRWDEMESYITSAQNILAHRIEEGQISEKDPELLILRGDIYSFRAKIALQQNNLGSALEYAQEAVRIIPQTARSRIFALGSLVSIYQAEGDINQAVETCIETITAGRELNYPSMHMSASYALAQMLRVQGRLEHSAQVLRDALQFAERHGQAGLYQSGILHIGLADTLYETNALDEMEAELENGLALCRQGGMSTWVMVGLFTRALLKHARGDLKGALSTLEEIERDCKDMALSAYMDDCVGFRLQWRAEQGDITGLGDWIKQVDFNVERKLSIDRFFQLYQASLFLYLLDRCEEALHLLERLKGTTQENGYAGWLIRILVLLSVLLRKMKEKSRALDCLSHALGLAEPRGYVRLFLNQGDPMMELLRVLQQRGSRSEFLDRLLSAFPSLAAGKPIKSPPANMGTPGLVDALTSREIEILLLINAGLSNNEIAERLVISVGTVKAHTSSIYRKLDVQGRTKAIVKAREIDIL